MEGKLPSRVNSLRGSYCFEVAMLYHLASRTGQTVLFRLLLSDNIKT